MQADDGPGTWRDLRSSRHKAIGYHGHLSPRWRPLAANPSMLALWGPTGRLPYEGLGGPGG